MWVRLLSARRVSVRRASLSANTGGRRDTRRALPSVEPLESRELFAVTYYVSPTGQDHKNGTSPTTAWKTISKVNTKNLQAGDTVLFQGGATFSGSLVFDFNDKGTALAPVTIGSYGTGRATLRAGTGGGVSAQNVAGLTFRNLNFVGDGASVNTKDGLNFWNTLAGDVKLQHLYFDQIDVSGFGKKGIAIGGQNNRRGYREI